MLDDLLIYVRKELSINGLLRKHFSLWFWTINIVLLLSLLLLVYFLINQNMILFWIGIAVITIVFLILRCYIEKKLANKLNVVNKKFRKFFLYNLDVYLKKEKLDSYTNNILLSIDERIAEIKEEFLFISGIFSALFLILFAKICDIAYEKFIGENMVDFFCVTFMFFVIIYFIFKVVYLFKSIYDSYYTSMQSLKYAKGLLKELLLTRYPTNNEIKE